MDPVTIKVPGFEVSRTLRDPLARPECISRLCGRPLEQHYDSATVLVTCNDRHALVQAAHDAFYEHRPLSISPDAIWFCIVQGVAHHVRLNRERLRRAFVAHEGKLTLMVDRRDFMLRSPNPWPEAFSSFSEQIARHIGSAHALLVADYSTTGPEERAASEIVLMDTFQGYFEYEMRMGCGIPEITLLGTVDDWVEIRRRAEVFGEYGLSAWLAKLLPVLDQLVETSRGRADIDFWRSVFRYESASGPSEMTGWITALFPYLRGEGDGTWNEVTPNPYLADWHRAWARKEQRTLTQILNEPRGPTMAAIPSSLNRAPIRFTGINPPATGHFVGGMFGVAQDQTTGALAPEFGWAVTLDG